MDRQPNISGNKHGNHTSYDEINDMKKGTDSSSDPNVVDEPVNLQQTNDAPKPSNKND